jgi:hypothetical protein
LKRVRSEDLAQNGRQDDHNQRIVVLSHTGPDSVGDAVFQNSGMKGMARLRPATGICTLGLTVPRHLATPRSALSLADRGNYFQSALRTRTRSAAQSAGQSRKLSLQVKGRFCTGWTNQVIGIAMRGRVSRAHHVQCLSGPHLVRAFANVRIPGRAAARDAPAVWCFLPPGRLEEVPIARP